MSQKHGGNFWILGLSRIRCLLYYKSISHLFIFSQNYRSSCFRKTASATTGSKKYVASRIVFLSMKKTRNKQAQESEAIILVGQEIWRGRVIICTHAFFRSRRSTFCKSTSGCTLFTYMYVSIYHHLKLVGILKFINESGTRGTNSGENLIVIGTTKI